MTTDIGIRPYDVSNETLEIAEIDRLLAKDLSEPYSFYVYQYFLKDWPNLTFLARHGDKVVGAIVASVREHKHRQRGYIAMLVVQEDYRGKGIAKKLITRVVDELQANGADEVTLETEVSNAGALALYENLGFIRSRRMYRYYLNTSDAFRLSLPLTAEATKSTVVFS